jgi:hypothetical protein
MESITIVIIIIMELEYISGDRSTGRGVRKESCWGGVKSIKVCNVYG